MLLAISGEIQVIRLNGMIATALTVFMVGCATVPALPLPEPVEWVATSPEWKMEALETFEAATAYINETGATRSSGTWVVVLDLDETVLNNINYMTGLAREGETYTPESWHDWTQERSASLVPGAKTFIQHVNVVGGHIAFVTNRSDVDQLATEENLARHGLLRSRDFRILLTRAAPEGESNKTSRYAVIPDMLETMGYPDAKIIAYVGDNIGDQPDVLGSAQFFCVNQGGMYGDPCAVNAAGYNTGE